jgi:hypothetical protein
MGIMGWGASGFRRPGRWDFSTFRLLDVPTFISPMSDVRCPA